MSIIEMPNLVRQPRPAARVHRGQHKPRHAELRAIILLAGCLGNSGIVGATRQPALDLPIDDASSLLDCWYHQIVPVAQAIGAERMPVRVLTNLSGAIGLRPVPASCLSISVECDPSELRGTAGLLRDASVPYPDESFIVVANAAQLLMEPLEQLVEGLYEAAADVAILSDDYGSVASLMLIRCGCLAQVPTVGYVDMKEQGLASLAKKFDVRVVRSPRRVAMPIRTASDYIKALRWHHKARNSHSPGRGAQAPEEDWSPLFALCQEGARVDPSAQLFDSVVLRGATVERGAILVRCVVCSGAVVARKQTLVDQVVT